MNDRRLTYRPGIEFATTSRCNYRCRMCRWGEKEASRELLKADPNMTMDLFRRVLEESAAICSYVSLTSTGEFLCDPLKDERMAILGDFLRRHEYIKFIQTTNASMLNAENLAFLQDAPDVTFFISLDSTDALEYASIRRPGFLSNVETNIFKLRATLKALNVRRVALRFMVVLMKRTLFSLPGIIRLASRVGATLYYEHVAKFGNSDEMAAESLYTVPALANRFLEKCIALADHLNVNLDRCPSPFALVPLEVSTMPAALSCYQLEETGHVRVLANGDVLPCCGPGNLVIGNANDQPITEILFGEKVEAYRAAIAAGNPLPPCDHCRFLQRSSKLLYDAKDYGWDIPDHERCYDDNPNLERYGFFSWLSELPNTRLRTVLTNQYLSRASKMLQHSGIADLASDELAKAAQANRCLFPLYRAGETILVYGAGVDARWLYKNTILKDMPIVGFADSDSSKQGRALFDFPIVAPRDMAGLSPRHVVLASRRYKKAILETIRGNLGVNASVAIPLCAEE
jgi:MoaA/NifB/PqqE/SkfB family radical SAM enzyme